MRVLSQLARVRFVLQRLLREQPGVLCYVYAASVSDERILFNRIGLRQGDRASHLRHQRYILGLEWA